MFKNIKTGRVDQFSGEDIEKVQWLKRAKGFCLKIMLQNGQIHRFDGFKEGVSRRKKGFHYENLPMQYAEKWLEAGNFGFRK